MRIVAAVALASAILGTAASAACAQGAWDGYLSGAFGSTEFAGDPPIYPNGDWIGQGRATFEAHSASNWGFQADGVYTYQNLSELSGYSDAKFASTDAALHGFYRMPGHALFGVIGQWQQNEYRLYPSHWTMTQYWAGVEAQVFSNNLSLYGKAAWKSSSIAVYSYTATGWTASARARYFFSPNFLVEGNLDFDRSNQTGGGSMVVDAISFGGGVEYQLPSLPVSVSIRYAHESIDAITSVHDRHNNDRILFGAKWNFGGKSLWERETNGASLDPFAPYRFGYSPLTM